MDKIWDRNPSKSEVIGRCGGDEKPNDHAEPIKVERQNKKPQKTLENNNKADNDTKSIYFITSF